MHQQNIIIKRKKDGIPIRIIHEIKLKVKISDNIYTISINNILPEYFLFYKRMKKRGRLPLFIRISS